jgi:hypothetical protein
LTLVRLRLLAAQKLFCVFERVLDSPSVVVTFQNLDGGHCQIGRKEKIVSFFASRVSAYYKQYRLMRNPIPYYLTGINQSLYCFASLAKLYLLPVVDIRSHLLRVGKAFAFLARPASGFLSSFGRQIENLCVALYTRNKICLEHLFSSQRCVKAVCNQSKPPFRQPLMELVYHLHCQFYQSIAVLAVQSHVDRQSQRFAAPGRLYLQCQDDQIQSPRIDNALLCRANSIPPITCAIDFSAAAMKQCIVQSNSNDTCRAKDPDQCQCQDLPEFVDVPTAIWKETMVGIVSTLKAWVGKWKDASYCFSSRAQYPSTFKSGENLCPGSSKNWKKLLGPLNNLTFHKSLDFCLLFQQHLFLTSSSSGYRL